MIADALGAGSEPVHLFVKEVRLKVLGKELTVIAIEQADGTPGYSPEKGDGFHVAVVNQLKVPTSIHWHGIVLPNLMDGVPFVTQNPIPTGKSLRYDFPSNKAALTGCIRITAFRNTCITCATDYLGAGGTGKSYHLDTGMHPRDARNACRCTIGA